MSKKLLAVDTATDICGVAIIADGRIHVELSLNLGGTHTKHILTAIDAALSLGGVTLNGIDAFAVTRGPGSFTGLRIGVSTMKGLAVATAKPIIGVSSLEVLAHQAGEESVLVCPMMDARRNEIYWSIFRRKGDTLCPLSEEQVGPIDKLAGQIDEACMFIGNAAPLYANQLSRLIRHPIQWPPEIDNAIRPGVLAQLAWQRFGQGQVDDVETFVPVYIRKSDAEKKRVD